MDLRTGHRLAYRAHVRARGDDVVVYGQAVDTEDPRSRQHQLQGGVKRIAIDNDRSAGDRIRLAGVGIHGRTLTPTLTTVPCTRRVHMRGWFAPRRRSATPGRLLVMGCSLQNSVTRSNGHSIRAVRLDVFRVLPADTGQAVGAASPACPTANSTW